MSKQKRNCTKKGEIIFNIQEYRNKRNGEIISSIPTCDDACQCDISDCKWNSKINSGIDYTL